jgi:hypothetical protein
MFNFPVSTPVIYQIISFRFIWTYAWNSSVITGLVKQITYSTVSGSLPISRTMVCLKPLVGIASNLFKQGLCTKVVSVSLFRRHWIRRTALRAIYLFAQKKIFELGHHHSDYQVAPPTGPSIRWALNVLARGRPLNSDSPLLSSTQPFSQTAGTPVCMPHSVNSIEPRGLIQTVKMSPGT